MVTNVRESKKKIGFIELAFSLVYQIILDNFKIIKHNREILFFIQIDYFYYHLNSIVWCDQFGKKTFRSLQSL